MERRKSGKTGGSLQSICRRAPAWLGVLLFALVLAGCSSNVPAPVYDAQGPAPAGYYRVRSGDTLYSIAKRHKVGYETMAGWNKLSPPYRIYAGSLLRVRPPDGQGRSSSGAVTQEASSKKATTIKPTTQSSTRSEVIVQSPPAPARDDKGSGGKPVSGLRWRWPVKGEVVQTYRVGDRTRQGIRIAGRPGQKVLAAEGGIVVYRGSGLKGYGNLIIVKHNDTYLSAYGFNRRLLVDEGARVKRGQAVAEVGQASGGEYLLHFEIRKNGTAVDPLKYLP